jgi:light-regulated signal transduction histidine kinase (bacteriophytochrome)
VCERLKADERTREIPVIFISALHEPFDKVKAFSLGGVDYITKPFQSEEIVARVKTHLHLQQLWKHLEEKNQTLSTMNAQLTREIAERKQTEEKMRMLNAELENRVKQRTTDLEFANRELRHLLKALSHDLKTPLRGISHLAYWLMRDYAGVFDEKGADMAEQLICRVKRLDLLLNRILEYSRINRVIESPQPIHVEPLVNNVIKKIAPPDSIHIRIEHELPVIVGDKMHIQQIFHNLLQNAVECMHNVSGQIAIRYVDDGAFWKFSVKDNGIGIEKKYHEKIFQIFQTLHSWDELGKPGIGLAIVKKIVMLYQGEIWVESTVGKGSEFFFTFPKEEK